LESIAREQVRSSRGTIHGEAVHLLPMGASAERVVGRFGWKAQHASLLDASGDALFNELGIPNRIFPGDRRRGGAKSKRLSEMTGDTTRTNQLDEMVSLVRDSEPVLPDPVRIDATGAQVGSKIFDQIGCSLCHVRTLRTAPSSTRMPGSGIIVSEKLGNKEIHPFSDYLLHDVGTGAGIVRNVRPEDYDQSTANKFRTAPLWGLRYRLWMMHDGQSVTYHQAIMRHRGEALDVTLRYANLSAPEQRYLDEFLASL